MEVWRSGGVLQACRCELCLLEVLEVLDVPPRCRSYLRGARCAVGAGGDALCAITLYAGGCGW